MTQSVYKLSMYYVTTCIYWNYLLRAYQLPLNYEKAQKKDLKVYVNVHYIIM